MDAQNFVKTNKIEIVKGLFIESKIRLGAVVYLENKFDKKLEDIDWENARVGTVIEFVIAMALQSNDKTEEEIRKIVEQIPVDEINELTSKITSVFDVKLKNSSTPEEGENVQVNP